MDLNKNIISKNIINIFSISIEKQNSNLLSKYNIKNLNDLIEKLNTGLISFNHDEFFLGIDESLMKGIFNQLKQYCFQQINKDILTVILCKMQKSLNKELKKRLLRDLLKSKHLNKLELNGKSYVEHSQFISSVTSIVGNNEHDISYIDIRYNYIPNKSFFQLLKLLNKNSTVKTIWAYFNQLDAISSSPLMHLGLNNSLKVLYLSNNMIGPEGCFYISLGLENNKCLESLYLANNHLGDKGMFNLSRGLIKNCTLKELDYRANLLKSEGLSYFSQIYSSPQSETALVTVYFSNNKLKFADISSFISILKNRGKGLRTNEMMVESSSLKNECLTFHLHFNLLTPDEILKITQMGKEINIEILGQN
jgi:hypothetical protein